MKKREKGSDVIKKKEEAMSGDSVALIIFIVFCRVLPRMAAHTHTHAHSSTNTHTLVPAGGV